MAWDLSSRIAPSVLEACLGQTTILLSFLVSRFNVFVGSISRRGVAGYELLDEILFRHQGRAKTVASIASSPHLYSSSVL